MIGNGSFRQENPAMYKAAFLEGWFISTDKMLSKKPLSDKAFHHELVSIRCVYADRLLYLQGLLWSRFQKTATNVRVAAQQQQGYLFALGPVCIFVHNFPTNEAAAMTTSSSVS